MQFEQSWQYIQGILGNRLRRVSLVAAVAVMVVACASMPPPADRPGPQAPAPAPAAVMKWERAAGGAFENRGVAKVEPLGPRWMLTVMCGGTHSTYLDDTTIDLARYAKGYVSARYTWVTRKVSVQCPVAPCGQVNERRIALERLTVVSVTAEQAQAMARECEGQRVNG